MESSSRGLESSFFLFNNKLGNGARASLAFLRSPTRRPITMKVHIGWSVSKERYLFLCAQEPVNIVIKWSIDVCKIHDFHGSHGMSIFPFWSTIDRVKVV